MECVLRCNPHPDVPSAAPSGVPRLLRLLVLVGLVCLLGCQERDAALGEGSLALHGCRVAGIDTEVRCGDLQVPEQRLPAVLKGGRMISIHVVVIPAIARGQHLDPIFVIAGGPGQAASSTGAFVQPLFARLNRERDIVLIDQRGTGESHPLKCEAKDEREAFAEDLDPKSTVALFAHCAADLEAQGNDLTQYTTAIAVADFDAVRAALGYRMINLWGVSYGTRVELEYLRQFGPTVRSAVLDGVAPANMKLPISFAFDAEAALDHLIADCRTDVVCNARRPNLGARIDGLFARLAQDPIRTSVRLPRSGRDQTVEVSRSMLSSWVRAPLYSPVTASLIPSLVMDAAAGDFSPFAAASEAVTGELAGGISFGMHLSVVCSEDMTLVTPGDIASLENTRFGESFFDEYRDLCARWPVGRMPPHYFDAVTSDVPVLLLSGGLDPATPPRYAEKVAATLAHARSLVAPNLGHGVSPQGCAPELIERFIRSADPAAIDGKCLLDIPRPPFFAPLADPHS